jgi:alginate O-acetyltransferase complex protein AlgI
MSYHSWEFTPFFTAFLCLYSVLRDKRLRQGVLLAGNLLFYYLAAGINALLILLLTFAVLRVCSHGIAMGKGRTPVKYLAAGIFFLLGILIYTKAGLRPGMTEVYRLSDIRIFQTFLIPRGISYYTLSSVGYLLDLYHHKVHFRGNYRELFLSLTFFPQIVEGPVSRYDRLIDQYDNLPPFSVEKLCKGLQRMLWGYMKKMILADRIAIFTNDILHNPGDHAGSILLLAVMLGAVQLYADFSGCMDIVIGAAETMGISLDENFRQPFFADSIADFWRRWHITLLNWFRDYIYLPLAVSPLLIRATQKIRKRIGKNGGKVFAGTFPVFAVWGLTGLWHAFSGCYLLWGFYWAAVLTSGRYTKPILHRLLKAFSLQEETVCIKCFRAARIFCLFCIGRSFTVTGSLAGCRILYHQIFHQFHLWEILGDNLYTHGLDWRDFRIILFGILLLTAVDYLQHKGISMRAAVARQPLPFRWLFWYGGIAVTVLFGIYGTGYQPAGFMYAGF